MTQEARARQARGAAACLGSGAVWPRRHARRGVRRRVRGVGVGHRIQTLPALHERRIKRALRRMRNVRSVLYSGAEYVASRRSSSAVPASTTSRTSRCSMPRDALVVITGPVGLRQVVAGVRHDLRRGAAPVRRVAERLRAPVPRADGQAGRGLHRGAVAGDLDRPEDDLAQPAVDGRHGHRDLRLPAPAVGADRQAALLQLRPPDRRASRPSRSSTRSWASRTGRSSWSSRRSCAAARASSASSSSTCARRASRASKVDGELRLLEEEIVARQEVQARHVGGRGPAGHAAGGAQAARRTRWRPRSRWPTGCSTSRRAGDDGRGADVLGALRLPALRHLDAGARAAVVLVQLAARRLPALHGARLADGDRPGARGAGPVAVDQRGRDPAVVERGDELLRADDRRRSPSATRSTSTRRGRTCRRARRTCSCTARTATGSTSPTATGWGASART